MKNVVKHSLVQFTQVGNVCLRNKDISNGAKGLYAILWDLPDDWELTYHGLAAKCKDGVSAIKTQMHELLAEGYVVVEQKRGEDGRMGVNVWNILCVPAPVEERTPVKTRKKREDSSKEAGAHGGSTAKEGSAQEGNKEPLIEKPLTDFPLTEKPLTVNRTQDNKENNIIREEGKSLKSFSTQHTHKGVDEEKEKFFVWFKDMWNGQKNALESKTATFSRLTAKRRELIGEIFKEFKSADGKYDIEAIKKGVHRAMVSPVGQGTAKGMRSPADIEYLLRLDNFIKLVEGSM